MKALITGATGFLGGALVERLLREGSGEVRCLLRTGSPRARLEELVQRYPEAKVELYTGSLGSVEAARAAIAGVDVVYHLAASLRGVAADIFLGTVVATKNLLEALRTADREIKLVLVSSFGVYGVADLPRGHLVDEGTPIEPHPARRDLYSHAKLRQEALCREYELRDGLSLSVLRPGVIYGPRGSALSARVGLDLFGVFWFLGGDNVLPLSYVENCADAIALAGASRKATGQTFNVHDDDLPTCREYLGRYEAEVKPLRSIRVPYAAALGASALLASYHARSRGQLPAIFTPYKTATSWKGNRFTNAKLKELGWSPRVSTREGMRRAFEDQRLSAEARGDASAGRAARRS